MLATAIRALMPMVACMFLFYLLPTLIEILLLALTGSSLVCVFWGDALGCAFIAAIHRKTGIALYVLLAAGGALLLSNGLVRPSVMVWLTDLVPAAILSGMAAAMTIAGRDRRP